MEPKNNINDFDLNALDLEIFSSTIPQNTFKKGPIRKDLRNKTYTKILTTLALLVFLFVSTFFIASRIAKPSFTTSSADIGYIPQAQINIPQSIGVQACSEINYETGENTFLHSYCRGDVCTSQPDKEICELIDVAVLKDGFLSEESGQDGLPDCIWIEEDVVCKPKY